MAAHQQHPRLGDPTKRRALHLGLELCPVGQGLAVGWTVRAAVPFPIGSASELGVGRGRPEGELFHLWGPGINTVTESDHVPQWPSQLFALVKGLPSVTPATPL